MLNVIDVSSNNGSLDPAGVTGADAVIVKVSQGLGYVNPRAAYQISRTRSSEKLLGLYHFAGLNSPSAEFAHFWATAKSYWKTGDVIVLDYEPTSAPSGTVAWVLAWAKACYAATGVWPWIYSYSSMLKEFTWSSVAANCAAWVAGGSYYNSQKTFSQSLTRPSVQSCWNVAGFQYSQVGRPAGTSSATDLSVFYGTRADWLSYGGSKVSTGVVSTSSGTSTASTSTSKTTASTTGITIGGITVATTMTEAQFIEAVAEKVAQKVANQVLGHSGPTIGAILQTTSQQVTSTHTDVVKVATKLGVKL